MADVISVTNSDSAFDASKGVTRANLPPFAQRLRKAADLVWEEGYRQPFIRELGEGALPREKFAFYLLQDFRYLNDYARVHALGLAKTDDPEIMAFMLNVQNGALNVESTVHRTYLASYGITDEQMNNVRQSAFARAYTSNILSIAYGKDILDILVAVLPCAWVYADYGYRLAHEFADTLDVNQYKSWVDMYKTDEFWQGSAWLIEHIEKLAAEVSEERKQELVDIFVTGVENEYMFWSSAYDMQYTWKPEWDQES
ncbi:thiaminase II [Bifidobacterium adolescentis]|uniref:thiaminase II n=1 Tax=Bifidobacterium adolescentis TaxID=1680 RepID=UPI0034A220B4